MKNRSDFCLPRIEDSKDGGSAHARDAVTFNPNEFRRPTHGKKTYVDHIKDVNYWHAALDLIAERKLELVELITHRVSLEQAVKVFEYYNRAEMIKVLVEPFRD